MHANDFTGKWLYFYREYQPVEFELATRLLNPGDMVLDVGANVGIFSLLIAKECASKIIAVEPLRKNIEILKRNINRLGFSEIISVQEYALGQEEKEIQVSHNSDHSGINIEKSEGETKEIIKVKRLDDLWKNLKKPKFRIMKLDVEGFEMNVLKGAREMFETSPPEICIVEFNPDYTEKTTPDSCTLWEYFINRGYIAYNSNLDIERKPRLNDFYDVFFSLEELTQCV